jgi:hypothetical protein
MKVLNNSYITVSSYYNTVGSATKHSMLPINLFTPRTKSGTDAISPTGRSTPGSKNSDDLARTLIQDDAQAAKRFPMPFEFRIIQLLRRHAQHVAAAADRSFEVGVSDERGEEFGAHAALLKTGRRVFRKHAIHVMSPISSAVKIGRIGNRIGRALRSRVLSVKHFDRPVQERAQDR